MSALTCTRRSREPRGPAHVFRFATAVLVFRASLSTLALAQPAVTVSPTTGPPTDKVTVGGTGFAADEAVDIYFDTTDLALATTGASGSFTGIRLTIPASPSPGTHWTTGVGRRSGLAAQTRFTVQTDCSCLAGACAIDIVEVSLARGLLRLAQPVAGQGRVQLASN